MRDSQGCCPDRKFRNVLEDLLTDTIIVIIKSGGPAIPLGFEAQDVENQGTRCIPGCCKQKGKLCTIGVDYIQLLADEGEIIIPFNAIAAVIDPED